MLVAKRQVAFTQGSLRAISIAEMHIPVGTVGLNLSRNVTPRSFRYDTCLMLTIGSRGSKVNWGNHKHKEWRKETQHIVSVSSMFYLSFCIYGMSN